MKKGIDLSGWNEIVDYNKMKQAGVEFAIVKVINAKNEADKRLYTHVEGLNKVGIPIIGGYTYTYANTIGKAEKASAAFVLRAQSVGINFMWLDIEDNVMKNLGSTLIDIIHVYKRAAENAGMGFGIYTGVSFYNTYMKKYASKMNGISFWFARYPYGSKEYTVSESEPSTRNLPSSVDVDGWQYTSKGVIPGAKGYIDIDVWYERAPFRNELEEIPVEYNPFTEPTQNVKAGAMGNDANWVLWYLWRFGKLVDSIGQPDATNIDGMITDADAELVGEVQTILGLKADKIVGPATRSVWKKIC